jgi:DNA uptake protein ComE-like DNA-binding protein
MTEIRRRTSALLAILVAGLVLAVPSSAQVGTGLLDPNVATEAQLTGLPHMTPAIVKAIVAGRPFMSIVDFNKFLLGQGLTQEQATELYGRAFVHVNLNTGTREEILLIPRAGNRMVREFAEYRPWTSWAQFDKEIGKYFPTDPKEPQRLKQYVFIPINVNTASDEVLMTIPGMTPRWLREFKEYRPYPNKAKFEKEIGKYLPNNPKEVERFWRYLVVN